VADPPGGSRQRPSWLASWVNGVRLARFANRPVASGRGSPCGSQARTASVTGRIGSPLRYRHRLTRQVRGRVLPSTAARGSRRSAAFAKVAGACSHDCGVGQVHPVSGRVLLDTAALVVAPSGGLVLTRSEVRLLRYGANLCTPPPGKVLPSLAVLVIAEPGRSVRPIVEVRLRFRATWLTHLARQGASEPDGPCGRLVRTARATGRRSLLPRPTARANGTEPPAERLRARQP